jgi:hypothetical protein
MILLFLRDLRGVLVSTVFVKKGALACRCLGAFEDFQQVVERCLADVALKPKDG